MMAGLIGVGMRDGKVAIVGAGIGGLALACLLADLGREAVLIERFAAPRPVGSGLVIQDVGLGVLARIGLAGQALALGQPLRAMFGHEARSGRTVLSVSYGATPGLGIHRASLFHLLWTAARARGVRVITGTRVTGRRGQVLLSDHGDIGPFGLIVDATGAGSALSPLVGRPLPYGAVWATVDWPATDLPGDELRQCYRRASRMAGVLPLGRVPDDPRPKAALFWSLPADGHPDWLAGGLAAWKAEALGLWPALAPFLDQLTDPDQFSMARYSHGALARPWSDGLVHIGDAAHRASPQLGQGANMALLDAAALSLALDQADGQDPLRLYAQARWAHVRAYQTLSAALTPQYQSDSWVLPVIRDHLLAPLSQAPGVRRALTRLVAGRLVPPLGSLLRASP
jgi:2-polyprenyl-6-methoxyphenol hydroxylase-like FAD-dependent oxidoreductase